MGSLADRERPLRIFMLAGEPSGDQHAARVVGELKTRMNCVVEGLAGPRMREAGVRAIVPMEEVSVVGFAEILSRLRSIVRARSRLLRALKDPPDLVLPIDYPGFNLRFAARAKRLGIPVLYYVGPQVWAWWKSRLRKMKSAVDHVAVVFPFEVPLYESAGIPVTYVGHPLAEDLHVDLNAQSLREKIGLHPDQEYLALFPGSRPHEIERLLQPMVDAFEILGRDRPDLEAVIAAASPEIRDQILSLLPTGLKRVHLTLESSHSVAAHARAALVTSGTATLETAALGTPLVIVYRLSWMTWMLARAFVPQQKIGLANIVAEEEVAPELLQGDATGEAMADALAPLLDAGPAREEAISRLAVVSQKLGSPGAAQRVAELAECLIKESGARRLQASRVGLRQ